MMRFAQKTILSKDAYERRNSGADEEIRTPDPFITSEVLYQLSYIGTVMYSNKIARMTKV